MKTLLSAMRFITIVMLILIPVTMQLNAHKLKCVPCELDILPMQGFTPNDDQVCFYENSNYGGNWICLTSSGDYVDLGRFFVGNTNKNWHDKISSVIIGANACAIMYEHPNGGGYCLTLRGTGTGARYIPNLSYYNFNDKASHIKSLPYPQNLPPEPNSNQVYFFEHNNYDGYCMGYNADRDDSNISCYTFYVNGPNWNDRISSIKVGSDACATTWLDANYKGSRNFWEGNGYSVSNYPDLAGTGLNDKITALKVRHRNGCAIN